MADLEEETPARLVRYMQRCPAYRPGWTELLATLKVVNIEGMRSPVRGGRPEVSDEAPADVRDLREVALAGYTVLTEITVLWSDEDAFAHVNNIAYLRWCETARVEYLRRIGLYPEVPPKGVGPIVASMTCHYRRALNYPDRVLVGTRVTQIGNSSFRMDHRIVSCGTRELAAEVESIMVAVDYATGKPVRVPPEIRRSIAELEGRSFD